LHGKISERSDAVLHAEIGTAAKYRKAKGPQNLTATEDWDHAN
jgi:hypothetical protein